MCAGTSATYGSVCYNGPQQNQRTIINSQSPTSPGGHLERVPHALANGRYELCEFVSKGGMGAVYRARDVQLGRWVAVKCLLDVTRETSRELAAKEARTLASLNHRNIMRVFDILQSGDQVWIVSEWLEGKSLAQLPMPLPPAAVLAIMAQVYDALASAHAAQVIHRDVKPANIIRPTPRRTCSRPRSSRSS
jgi:serine/threonine protein kinase